MNILFLTTGTMKNLDGNGLYIDLINEFKDNGNNLYILCPNEKRNRQKTMVEIKENVSILRVRTGNITKTNFLEKGISTILIELQFIHGIKKYYNNVIFDMILYTTPPVTFEKVVRYVKKRDNCLTYLILKDIFPQNAVDLGIITKKSFLYYYFRFKEKKLYTISDFIGCTSNGNIKYILKNNPEIEATRVELFPNSINPRMIEDRVMDRRALRKKYNIPQEAVVFVYGGNIGKPQGVDFIKSVIEKSKEYGKLFIMILGSGTEFFNIYNYIEKLDNPNVSIMEAIPEEEYWEFLSCCDVGLVFLDKRFTVPNTPARITYYMEAALPILAATDKNTDINDILTISDSGFWVESGDINKYYEFVELLMKDDKLRHRLGRNGRLFLEDNLVINKNYEVLISHYKGRED